VVPLTSVSEPLRAGLEMLSAGAVSGLAFMLTTPEIALLLSFFSSVILVVVWLVRVEMQGKANAEALAKLDRRMDTLVQRLGGV